MGEADRTGPRLVAWVDGGARGNPGPAAWAAVVEDASGTRLAELSGTLGVATNNVAEYRGLLAALEYAVEKGAFALHVRTDSELMQRQITGRYKVRHPGLRELHDRARRLVEKLGEFRIAHVRREANREADRLVNLALDAQRAPEFPEPGGGGP